MFRAAVLSSHRHFRSHRVALVAALCLAGAVSGAEPPVTDTHFHPCPFGEADLCIALGEMLPEMDRAGVTTTWVFGLQHQLDSDPGDIGRWASKNTCDLVAPMTFPSELDSSQTSMDRCREIHKALGGKRPFHYNDPCAKPGWPLAPNTRADEWIFEQYVALPDAAKARIKPFLSYLDFDDPCARDASGERKNLAYVKAMDRKYPGVIHGFAEHNLNKIVLYTHNACRPDADAFRRCSRGLMRYIAKSRRPLGLHFDLETVEGESFGKILLDFAKRHRRNLIVWLHGGIAPEVSDRLTAREHIAVMEAFLDTAPGDRYVELSWWNGFFRRLDPSVLERDQFGWPVPRDFEAEKALYRKFFLQHRDQLLFGSDQVSLFYDELVVDGLKLHAGYDDNYRKEIEKEQNALRDLIPPDTPEGAAWWQAVMSGNAERILEGIVWEEARGD